MTCIAIVCILRSYTQMAVGCRNASCRFFECTTANFCIVRALFLAKLSADPIIDLRPGGAIKWQDLRRELKRWHICDIGVDELLAAIPAKWLSKRDSLIRLPKE